MNPTTVSRKDKSFRASAVKKGNPFFTWTLRKSHVLTFITSNLLQSIESIIKRNRKGFQN